MVYLNKIQPNYKKLVVLFCEIKDNINSLIPSREDLHNEYNNMINKDLLDKLLDNKLENIIYLKELCVYLIEIINSLEASVEDEDTKHWLEQLNDEFNGLNEEEDTYYSDVLNIYIRFIKKSHEKIDTIKRTIIEMSV
jgi:hypothetical protein